MIANIHLPRPMRGIFCAARRLVLAAAVLSFLSACGSSPTQTPLPEEPVTLNKPPPALPATPEQAFDIAALDEVTTTALTEGTLAARIRRNALLARGLDATTLALINARLAWLDGDAPRALSFLDEAATANIEGRALLLTERQTIAELRREWLSAARLAWQRGQLLAAEREARQEELFANLMRLSDTQLRRARSASNDPVWRGWLELALAYRDGRDSVLRWIAQAGQHPAAANQPAALGAWLAERPPEKIAVLLPLSGRLQQAGEAVLDGLVRGLYRRYPAPETRPELFTIDAALTSDPVEAYRQAVTAGADRVIGPLTREQVNVAARMDLRPVPQLALNRPDGLTPDSALDWAAISLSPEDEAAQIAELAFGDGLRQAAIVRPATDWGQRMEVALVDRWRQLGGRVIGTATIDGQIPATQQISDLLGSGSSEQRIKAVEDAFEAPVTSRPRRRADLDVVFLLAPDPGSARELRPLLVYHYGGDLPVFGPASVYSGDRQSRNQDLNGLVFVEAPAVLDAASIDRFTRLRALGEDAITVLDHWQQMQANPQARVLGQTGLLYRTASGELRRQLIPTRFDGDSIRPLPVR